MAFTEGSKVIAAVDCEIFASPTSDYVIGKLIKHQSVVAAGSVVVVDEYKMLPIKPRGAVQVDYLEGMESLQLEGVDSLKPDVEAAQVVVEAAMCSAATETCNISSTYVHLFTHRSERQRLLQIGEHQRAAFALG